MKVIHRDKEGAVGIDEKGKLFRGVVKSIPHSSLDKEVKKEKDRVNITWSYNGEIFGQASILAKNYVEQSEDERKLKDSFPVSVIDWKAA